MASCISGSSGGSGLSGFLTERFVLVANALEFVDIRRTQRADLCCNLPDLLAVDTGYCDACVAFDGDLDALGYRKLDRVRFPKREIHRAALDLGTVADSVDFEVFAESVGV